MNVKFKSLLIKTDVTAIKIAKHAIFAGKHFITYTFYDLTSNNFSRWFTFTHI